MIMPSDCNDQNHSRKDLHRRDRDRAEHEHLHRQDRDSTEHLRSGSVLIRTASAEDAAALLEIYAPYILETAITFEYDVPTVDEFARRITHTLRRYPYLAAETGGKIVGYAYASPFKERAAYDWAAETSIYVAQDCRGMGVGTRLYTKLEDILRRQNIVNSNACIAYPNPESIRFHEKMGYRTVAHFTKCGYKLGSWYDMIWMEKMLDSHREDPPAVIPFPKLDS